jgi:anthrone oxygenase-like protein
MLLAILTFAATCAYAGAGFYINIVEQPARLQLNAQAMVHEWEPSNRRGFVLQSAFAIVASVLAYAYYARTGDARWIIGGTIMLASLPYAYFVIVPVNIWLYALEEGAPSSTLQELMRSWGLLEWGHTLIGVAGAIVIAWALIKPA